jgi:hypothetical protein
MVKLKSPLFGVVIPEEIKKKIDFFQDLSQIYWGIPNAFFVPGKKQ